MTRIQPSPGNPCGGIRVDRHRHECGRWALAVVVLPCALVLSGCVCGSDTYISDVVFSPDGKYVAYRRRHDGGIGHLLILALVWRKDEVRWCRASAPDEQRSVVIDQRVGFWILGGGPRTEWTRDVRFSPDSRQLAIQTTNGLLLAIETTSSLLLVDVATGKVRRPVTNDERIESFTWFGPGEIVWCEIVGEEKGREGAAWRIWRLDVNDPQAQTKLAATGPYFSLGDYLSRGGGDLSHVEWSPTGKHVLIALCYSVGPCAVVDLETGERTVLSPPGGQFSGAAWRADGSAVLVAFNIMKRDCETHAGNEFVSLDLATGRRHDWLRDLPASHPADVPTYSLMPLWTADHRYVVARTGTPEDWNWRLIRPDSGEEIVLPRRICWPDPLPIAGWFSTIDWNSNTLADCAVDYTGSTSVPLSEHEWAVSPDGKLLAEVTEDGKVNIVKLELPPLGD